MTDTDGDSQLDELATLLRSLNQETVAEWLRRCTPEALEALRQLEHPETGEQLQVKGVEAAVPPRHAEGGLTAGSSK